MGGNAMSQNQTPAVRSGGSNYIGGIMFILMGGLVIAIGTGLIHTDPSKIQTPAWISALFGMIFVLAGVWIIFQSVFKSYDDDSSVAGWANFAFAFTVMLLISVLCLWIGFGPGQRMFVQNVGTGIDPQTRPVDLLVGRIFCDIFGILMASLTVALAVRQVRKFLGR
jgi:hypothetical protein